jgi:hypothetical protein
VGGTCSTHVVDEICIDSLVRNLDGNRQLWRLRHRWEDNIKIRLIGSECEVVDQFQLTQDRDICRAIVNTVLNHRVYYKVRNLVPS